MSKANPQRFLEAAFAAVKKAEPVFVRHFGKPSGIEKKAGIMPSLVSDADREIERFIAREISKQFPGHAIVGEELAPAARPAPYTWFIDPIDGTTNYVYGFSHCCISLGLRDARGPLVGLVSDPLRGIRYHASRGGGAFCDGRALRVSSRAPLKNCLGEVGWSEIRSGAELLQKIAPHAYRVRTLGSSALALCSVASGGFDFYVCGNVSLWDVAAGELILSEAGGTATDWSGGLYTRESTQIAASNGKIHEELVQFLKR